MKPSRQFLMTLHHGERFCVRLISQDRIEVLDGCEESVRFSVTKEQIASFTAQYNAVVRSANGNTEKIEGVIARIEAELCAPPLPLPVTSSQDGDAQAGEPLRAPRLAVA